MATKSSHFEGRGTGGNLFPIIVFTTTLPAQLSVKFKCDIIPVCITRQDDGNFLLEFFEQLQINKEDKSEENILEITEKLNSIIEKMILNNPGDWIWTHNRWK